MTRLVWLTKCPYVPQTSPSATNTVNWRELTRYSFFFEVFILVRPSPLHYDPSHHQLKP